MHLARAFEDWFFEIGDRAAFAINFAWITEISDDLVKFKLMEHRINPSWRGPYWEWR